MISSNVTEELETHNDETLFTSEEVSLGFINIDNDWLFLQGKAGAWKSLI